MNVPRLRATNRLGFASLQIAVLTISAAPAYAYIDPGAGSLIVQTVIGAVLGFLYLCKLYWRRAIGAVRALFGRRPPSK